MRPVYKGKGSNNKWTRVRHGVKFVKNEDGQQLHFDHSVEHDDDSIYFAFTYPYTYTMVQEDLDSMTKHNNNLSNPKAIYYTRELLTHSNDGRRIDLVTISASNGASPSGEREPVFNGTGIFPDTDPTGMTRPLWFPDKQILWCSARVHPGEVPAQHTMKGILALLLDKDNLIAQELRHRYVIKIVPMINPDGVFRGHFRLDQHGQNLNRYYSQPSLQIQPSVYAIKQLLDFYASQEKLALYLDLHAHASKRGCFIYGNVMDSIDDQVQNMLYCRLIALNTPNFDYEGCLFSREHMTRIDPGDRGAGLTAEGSGRVSTYLNYNIIHSYTLECNYNVSKTGNEVPETEFNPQGHSTNHQPQSHYSTYPEKYTPSIWQSVGRACITAMLDIRSQNPCGRIPKSKHKTLSRYRHAVLQEVRQRKEYKGQVQRGGRISQFNNKSVSYNQDSKGNISENCLWRRCIKDAGEDSHVCSITEQAPRPIDWSAITPNPGTGSGGNSRNSTSSSHNKAMCKPNSANSSSSNNPNSDANTKMAAPRVTQQSSGSDGMGVLKDDGMGVLKDDGSKTGPIRQRARGGFTEKDSSQSPQQKNLTLHPRHAISTVVDRTMSNQTAEDMQVLGLNNQSQSSIRLVQLMSPQGSLQGDGLRSMSAEGTSPTDAQIRQKHSPGGALRLSGMILMSASHTESGTDDSHPSSGGGMNRANAIGTNRTSPSLSGKATRIGESSSVGKRDIVNAYIKQAGSSKLNTRGLLQELQGMRKSVASNSRNRQVMARRGGNGISGSNSFKQQSGGAQVLDNRSPQKDIHSTLRGLKTKTGIPKLSRLHKGIKLDGSELGRNVQQNPILSPVRKR